MTTAREDMRKYLFIICFFLSYSMTQAQESQKLSKRERKEQNQIEAETQKKAIIELLRNQAWVIEAHTVLDRYSNSFQLNPSLNFVGVKGDEGALQLGFNGLIGWNGVGGVTIDGKVTKYELIEGKKKQVPSVSIRFQGRGLGSANISINVNTSGQATARVTGDFGERITFSGMLVSLENSDVYKGQSLF
jgi:hypothetical protein